MSKARQEQRHPERFRKRDVFIGYCRPDDMAGQFGDNLADLILWDGAHDQRIACRMSYVGGPRICESRNGIVQKFLETDATWLWMVDADMSFTRKVMYDMLETCQENSVKVLGALCFAGGRTWLPLPVIYAEPRPGHFERLTNYPDGLCKVAGTGAACILIHREVLETVGKEYSNEVYKWFAEVQTKDADYGEDLVFCIRARSVGYDVYVHTGIEVGHMKVAPLFSGLYNLLRSLPHHEAVEYEKAYRRAMGELVE